MSVRVHEGQTIFLELLYFLTQKWVLKKAYFKIFGDVRVVWSEHSGTERSRGDLVNGSRW